jgi:hypothetical protein
MGTFGADGIGALADEVVEVLVETVRKCHYRLGRRASSVCVPDDR